MRFYNNQHRYYCGMDLHARMMYVCIIDQAGTVMVHRNLPTTRGAFQRVIEPFREHLVVCVECVFNWYWIADLCAELGVTFVLGHALYMRAIHGGKTKNDKIYSEKIAGLLRGGMLPMAHVYPQQLRSTLRPVAPAEVPDTSAK
jgi:transposase